MVVESETELLCFCLTLFCDWSTKHALLSQPIRYKTNTNRALVARAFPRFSFPAFPAVCLFVCLFFPLSTLWLSRVFSFLQMGRFDNFGCMIIIEKRSTQCAKFSNETLIVKHKLPESLCLDVLLFVDD